MSRHVAKFVCIICRSSVPRYTLKRINTTQANFLLRATHVLDCHLQHHSLLKLIIPGLSRPSELSLHSMPPSIYLALCSVIHIPQHSKILVSPLTRFIQVVTYFCPAGIEYMTSAMAKQPYVRAPTCDFLTSVLLYLQRLGMCCTEDPSPPCLQDFSTQALYKLDNAGRIPGTHYGDCSRNYTQDYWLYPDLGFCSSFLVVASKETNSSYPTQMWITKIRKCRAQQG